MPASRNDATLRSSAVVPASSSIGLRLPMREEAPAASTMAASPCAESREVGAVEVIVVLRQDFLQSRQALHHNARAARHLVAHVVIEDPGALDARIPLLVFGLEPIHKIAQHR